MAHSHSLHYAAPDLSGKITTALVVALGISHQAIDRFFNPVSIAGKTVALVALSGYSGAVAS